MRYFLFTDIAVPVFCAKPDQPPFIQNSRRLSSELPTSKRREIFAEQGIAPPQTYRLLSQKGVGSIHVTFTDFDRGHLLIKATSLRKAYRLAEAVRSFYSLVYQHESEFQRAHPILVEVGELPLPSWTKEQLLDSVCRCEGRRMRRLLEHISLSITCELELRFLVTCVPKLVSDIHLRDAALHLSHSRYVFNGDHDSLVDDRAGSRRHLERSYLENRAQYELAFVAAFKGIERLLRTGQIKKNEVESRLNALPYKHVDASREYTRLFEYGRQFTRQPTYAELVKHFLFIRNSVAAHANPQPAKVFVLRATSIAEIQRFLELLCDFAMDSPMEGRLPSGAVIPIRA